MPKNTTSETKKRLTSADLKNSQAKKTKVNPMPSQQASPAKPTLESTIEDLVAKLNVQENVADLVMVTMAFLPEQLPSSFLSSYKPIADAGGFQQKRNLSKMLALLLNEAGLLSFASTSSNNGSFINDTREPKIISIDDLDNEDEENEDIDYNDQMKSSKMLEKKDSHESGGLESSREVVSKSFSLSRQHSAPMTPLGIKPPSNLQALVAKKNSPKLLN